MPRDELLRALGDAEWDEDERVDRWRDLLAGLPAVPIGLLRCLGVRRCSRRIARDAVVAAYTQIVANDPDTVDLCGKILGVQALAFAGNSAAQGQLAALDLDVDLRSPAPHRNP